MITFTIKDWEFISKEKAEQLFELIAKDWKYEIKKVTKKRTIPQNAYYRKLIEIIAKDVWDEKDYIHESLRMKFLLDRSRKLPFVKSTTSLNTAEMTDYIENIKNFVSTFWLILPSAEDFNTN
jgi:hypothetical protein